MKTYPMKAFLGVASALSVLALCCSFFCEHVLHLGVPYSSVLPSDPRGFDLATYQGFFRSLHHYEFMPLTGPPQFRYPAPVALIYWFYFSFPHPIFLFQASIVITMLVGSVLLSRRMRSAGFPRSSTVWFLGVTCLSSYPFWFEIHQANTELFIFIIASVAVYAFVRGYPTCAAVCIGVLAAMKIYPIIFFGLLLSRRKYREVFVGLACAVILTVACLSFVTPSIAYSWRGVSYGLNFYTVHIIQSIIPRAAGYDHSLFSVVKSTVALGFGRPDLIPLAYKFYLVGAAAVGTALYFLRIRFLPDLNQVFCFVLICTFLTPSSFDYTLISLYIPWAMLVIYLLRIGSSEPLPPGLTAAFVGLALLLGADTELIAHHYRFGGQVKALVFPFVLFIALRYPFATAKDGSLLSRSESEGHIEGSSAVGLPTPTR